MCPHSPPPLLTAGVSFLAFFSVPNFSQLELTQNRREDLGRSGEKTVKQELLIIREKSEMTETARGNQV